MDTDVTMKESEHLAAIKESLIVLKEAVQAGMEERQRTIGFHCSAAAADLLELFLQKDNIIDPGKLIKHDFFTSEKKARLKLPEEFPEKSRIISFMVSLETQRNELCYGKRKPKEKIERYLDLFSSIRKFFEEKLHE